jgi:thioredoxin reductase
VAPNAQFLPGWLLTNTGHVRTDARLATGDPRVFAVGAVRADFGGNLVEAMGEGVSTAEAAARRLVK